MPELFFHCSNDKGIAMGRCGSAICHVTEARDHAARLVQSLIMAPGPEDWRGWTLHVRDEIGDDIFAVPFASILGRPH